MKCRASALIPMREATRPPARSSSFAV